MSDSEPSNRRDFLKTSLAATAGMASLPKWLASQTAAGSGSFELNEITLDDLRRGLENGRFTARNLAQQYLSRIESIDKAGPRVNSVIEVNPDAFAIADDLDKEHQAKGRRSAFHGFRC
jgi:amidase